VSRLNEAVLNLGVDVEEGGSGSACLQQDEPGGGMWWKWGSWMLPLTLSNDSRSDSYSFRSDKKSVRRGKRDPPTQGEASASEAKKPHRVMFNTQPRTAPRHVQ
jgi:hypothetical protein